jgi:hypothetical protein
MQSLKKLAVEADKWYGRYTGNVFRAETIYPQNDSLFMGLPPEIRLMVYELVFSPAGTRGTRGKNILSILLLCRQVHGEAIVRALQTTKLHVPQLHLLNSSLERRIKSLGPLQQHLRHIFIYMDINVLDIGSATNPFILTQLPLHNLDIDFGPIEGLNNHWLPQNKLYHTLLSAILYQTTPKNSDASTISFHQSLVERTKRSLATMLMQKWPTKAQLYHFLLNMKTKKLTIDCEAVNKEILWLAFTHFDLVDDGCTVLRKGADGTLHGMVFGCSRKRGRSSNARSVGERSFVKMGVWPLLDEK